MEKQLKAYLQFITSQLDELEQTSAGGSANAPAIQRLWELHLAQVQAFQHERLIHLLVTFFFGALLLAFAICSMVWPFWQFLALDGILAVIVLFYLKHYFFLENTVQKLYPCTQRLHRLLDA